MTFEEAKTGYIIRLWDQPTRNVLLWSQEASNTVLPNFQSTASLAVNFLASHPMDAFWLQANLTDFGFGTKCVKRKLDSLRVHPQALLLGIRQKSSLLLLTFFIVHNCWLRWHRLRLVRAEDLQVVAAKFSDWRPSKTFIFGADFFALRQVFGRRLSQWDYMAFPLRVLRLECNCLPSFRRCSLPCAIL